MNHRCRERVRALRSGVVAQMNLPLLGRARLRDVREVVVVLSPPRGGSSLLSELLRSTDQLLSLYAQHNHLYRLNHLGYPYRGLRSDALRDLPAFDPATIEGLTFDLVSGLQMGGTQTSVDAETFACQLALHLPLQWPHLDTDAAGLIAAAREAVAAGGIDTALDDLAGFWLRMLQALRVRFPTIDPGYYDLPRGRVREAFPELAEAEGPPSSCCVVELPPFVLLRPRPAPSLEDLRTRPLMLKAVLDSHHPLFLERVFPAARFRYVHLTRNPAASINGLIDGWNSRAFFAHELPAEAPLNISGYSERAAWAKRWWNFTLPPSWEALTRAPIELVCAHQWADAHRDILQGFDAAPDREVHRLAFESVIADPPVAEAAITGLMSALGLRLDESMRRRLVELPVMNATAAPTRGRWRARRDTIAPVVARPFVAQVAQRLGYALEDMDSWP